jgi:hypothetical protein
MKMVVLLNKGRQPPVKGNTILFRPVANKVVPLHVNPIRSDFEVRVSHSLVAPPPEIEHSVDMLWRDAVAANAGLFDGESLKILSISSTEMVCTPVSYRYVYAQARNELLRDALDIRSAAVCGVLFVSGRLLVGLRSAVVTQCPNCWELAPSGTLPADVINGNLIDYKGHLMSELREEVAVDTNVGLKIEPFLLVEDSVNRVVDICCRIELDAASLALEHSNRSDEYQRLRLLTVQQARAEIASAPDGWVACSKAILNYISTCNGE